MSTQSSILVVEDEKNLGLTLVEYLEARGHTCKLASSCEVARIEFNQLNPKIVLMDIGLPDGDGIELAKEFRSHRQNFILFFLSAQTDPELRLTGLELGGDDYITKPFILKELTLRLEKAIQLLDDVPANDIRLGQLCISFDRYELIDGQGKTIPLSQKECAILKLLYQNKEKPVSREEILDKIWGDSKFPSFRTIDNYIVKFRKWAQSDPDEKVNIISVRSVGYKLSTRT